jgi:hypothetical protein
MVNRFIRPQPVMRRMNSKINPFFQKKLKSDKRQKIEANVDFLPIAVDETA